MLLLKDAREAEDGTPQQPALFSFGFFSNVGASLFGTTTFSYM